VIQDVIFDAAIIILSEITIRNFSATIDHNWSRHGDASRLLVTQKNLTNACLFSQNALFSSKSWASCLWVVGLGMGKLPKGCRARVGQAAFFFAPRATWSRQNVKSTEN
jgi:hypothetical protein